MYRWRSDGARKGNTKYSSTEVLREKRSTIVFSWVEILANNKCSTRIVLLTPPSPKPGNIK